MKYENATLAFIDLAIKTLALKPELIGSIKTDDDLINRVIEFSQRLSDATPPKTTY
jgi:hypothetical protein